MQRRRFHQTTCRVCAGQAHSDGVVFDGNRRGVVGKVRADLRADQTTLRTHRVKNLFDDAGEHPREPMTHGIIGQELGGLQQPRGASGVRAYQIEADMRRDRLAAGQQRRCGLDGEVCGQLASKIVSDFAG